MASSGDSPTGFLREVDEFILAAGSSPSPSAVESLAVCLLNGEHVSGAGVPIVDLLTVRLSIQRKPLVSAALARVLTHAPMSLTSQQWRPRFIRYLVDNLSAPLAIDPKSQGFQQEDALTQGVLGAERSFSAVLEQTYSLPALSHLHRGFMKALNSAASKAIVRPFLPEQLIDVRVATLFNTVDAYATTSGAAKVDAIALVREACGQYQDEARRFGTRYAQDILVRLASVLEGVAESDFSESRFSKPADLQIKPMPKKYPLAEAGHAVNLIIDIDNMGLGPAQSAELIIDTSDNVCLARASVFVGEIDRSVRIEIPGEVIEADVVALATASIRWENADRTLGRADLDFELDAQRKDIRWDDLANHEPYSLQPVTIEDQLVGRSEILSRLFSEARQRDVGSFFLYGQKRVGKTSIARTLATRILNYCPTGYCVVYLDGGDYVAADASKTVSGLGRRLCEQVRESDRRFGAIPIPSFDDSITPLPKYLDDVLAVSPDFRILFILDEFDELPLDLYRRGPIGDSFFLTLRAVTGRSNFGFGLVGGEKMELILSSQGDTLNRFQALRVDYFDREHHWADFCELVRRPAAGSIEFSDPATQRLYEATAGNPYFTILLCRALYRDVVRRHDGYVTEAEVDWVIREQIRLLAANSFQHFWEDGILDIPERVEQVSLDRRKLLLAFAHVLRNGASDTASISAEAGKLGLSASEVTTQVADFVRRNVLREEAASLRCVVPLFQTWLETRGAYGILTVSMDPEASDRLRHSDHADRIRPEEILALMDNWTTFKGQRLSEDRIRGWLDQFQYLDERRLMLRVLQNVKFYGAGLIRDRLRQADGVVRRAAGTPRTSSSRPANDVVVSYLGSPGKSGATYARLYADENRVSSANVVERDRIGDYLFEHDDIDSVVFLDDFLGTGSQAIEYLTLLAEGRAQTWPARAMRVFFVSVAGLQEAAQQAEETLRAMRFDLQVCICDPLGDQDRLFTPSSLAFIDNGERGEAETVARKYGRALWPQHPLGYGGLGLAIVFDQSIPNNSLPVLWQAGPGWRPLFPRHTV